MSIDKLINTNVIYEFEFIFFVLTFFLLAIIFRVKKIPIQAKYAFLFIPGVLSHLILNPVVFFVLSVLTISFLAFSYTGIKTDNSYIMVCGYTLACLFLTQILYLVSNNERFNEHHMLSELLRFSLIFYVYIPFVVGLFIYKSKNFVVSDEILVWVLSFLSLRYLKMFNLDLSAEMSMVAPYACALLLLNMAKEGKRDQGLYFILFVCGINLTAFLFFKDLVDSLVLFNILYLSCFYMCCKKLVGQILNEKVKFLTYAILCLCLIPCLAKITIFLISNFSFYLFFIMTMMLVFGVRSALNCLEVRSHVSAK